MAGTQDVAAGRAPRLNKVVRITLELDNEFLGLLRAECTMGGFANGEKRLTPSMVLAVVAGMEGMGAHAEQVWAATPMEWRPHIDVISDERRTYKDGKQISGPFLEAVKASRLKT